MPLISPPLPLSPTPFPLPLVTHTPYPLPSLHPSIKLASVDRTFSCEAAKRELGYRPAVSLDEGLRRTLASFQHLRRGVGGARPKST